MTTLSRGMAVIRTNDAANLGLPVTMVVEADICADYTKAFVQVGNLAFNGTGDGRPVFLS